MEFTLNRKELSQLLGCTPATITSWAEAGMPCLSAGAKGQEAQFDARAAVAWRMARERAGSGPAKQRSAFLAVRTRREELKALKEAGVLVEKAGVERVAFQTGRRVRDAMQSIPDRIASQLANEPDPGRIHSLLASEIRLALGAMADELGIADAARAA